jgi:hypothetical protein
VALAIGVGEILEIVGVEFGVAAPCTDPGSYVALGLSLDPNRAVLGRFGLNHYNAQGVMSIPPVIPDFDVTHHILRTAFETTPSFHPVTP